MVGTVSASATLAGAGVRSSGARSIVLTGLELPRGCPQKLQKRGGGPENSSDSPQAEQFTCAMQNSTKSERNRIIPRPMIARQQAGDVRSVSVTIGLRCGNMVIDVMRAADWE